MLTTAHVPARPAAPQPDRPDAPVSHFHLLKGAGPDDHELERLEINADSVVFVAESTPAESPSPHVVKWGRGRRWRRWRVFHCFARTKMRRAGEVVLDEGREGGERRGEGREWRGRWDRGWSASGWGHRGGLVVVVLLLLLVLYLFVLVAAAWNVNSTQASGRPCKHGNVLCTRPKRKSNYAARSTRRSAMPHSHEPLRSSSSSLRGVSRCPLHSRSCLSNWNAAGLLCCSCSNWVTIGAAATIGDLPPSGSVMFNAAAPRSYSLIENNSIGRLNIALLSCSCDMARHCDRHAFIP